MRPAPQLQLEAIVLHLADFGDAHRIVEVLAPEHGRLSLVARGARSSRRRFAGALDLFAGLSLQCRAGHGLWTLEAADIRAARISIRASLPSLGRATLLCECARLLAPEQQAAPGLYTALHFGLDMIEAGELAVAALAYPRLLTAAGICPAELRRPPDRPGALSEAEACRIERSAVAWVESQVGRALKSRWLLAETRAAERGTRRPG